MEKPLAGRVALVTGASRGIGRAVCLELARAGAHVLALARTQSGLEELDDEIRALGGEATLAPCDLKDFEALDRLGASIFARWGRLDIFIANGGVLGPITPLAHVEPKQWDDVIAVNVTSTYRLIRSLDMLLRRSEAGRVVVMTSGVAHRAEAMPYWGAYALSKAALDSLVRTYAAETKSTSKVKVMAVSPGPLRTRMRAAAMPGEDPMTLRTPEELAPHIVAMCGPAWAETGKVFEFVSGKVMRYRGPE